MMLSVEVVLLTYMSMYVFLAYFLWLMLSIEIMAFTTMVEAFVVKLSHEDKLCCWAVLVKSEPN